MPAAIICISRIADAGRGRAARLVRTLAAGMLATGMLATGMLATGLAGDGARAMTFALEQGEQGRKVVVARGAIEAGDAQRLRQALQGAERDDRGHRILVLDSPGGNVGEAFAMVEVMEAERVTTRVRAGTSCASSCAMIVFAAGLFRIVDPGGRLGIHTCYDKAAGARSTNCNEIIAQAAQKHGVPFIATFTLMQLTAPGSVRWLDAEAAACWQFSRDPAPPPGRKPPPNDPVGCTPPLAEPAKGPGLSPSAAR